MNFILRFFVSGLVLLLIDWLFESIEIASYGTALLAVFILSLMNFTVKPILHLFALPLTLLTFGLFSFVINAITFYLTAAIVSGFEVSSFWGALFGSIILGLIQGMLRKKD